MFDILQGDMTRSKVILTFTCLKCILRDQATLVVREPPCFQGLILFYYVALSGSRFPLDHCPIELLVVLFICFIAHLHFYAMHRRGVGLVGGALGLRAVIVHNV